MSRNRRRSWSRHRRQHRVAQRPKRKLRSNDAMPRDGRLPARSPRALDLLNFFVADVQTGFGPFVAVYLTTHKWTQVQIGFALTLGTVVAMLSQIPAGALVDAASNKRVIVSGALIAVITAALL